MVDGAALRRVCGQLVVGGFQGEALPATFTRALAAGERGGAVLFARNLTQDPMQCAELARAIAEVSPREAPPLVAIDQEGGRVQRLQAPVLPLPPMRTVAERGDEALARRLAAALGRQLAALGITMDFAPVFDVNTCRTNPIIGDRAFGEDAATVHRFATAFSLGLRDGGVLTCAKHFPGHGDTTKDSHLDLPVVTLGGAELARDHVRPFLAAPRAHDAMMTAHVVYTAIDPELPATLSRAALALARGGVEPYAGCLLSDDLEMKAVADRWAIEDSAVRAIDAGCDALLVCSSEELQERAVDALARRAAEDAAFAARCREAHDRFVAMRARVPPRPVASRAAFDDASAAARAVAVEIPR
jgi:beta-N-acetylhexosaminidase